MMFSVIVPVYNAAEYLRRTLDSVFAAASRLPSPSEVELILVDDGSSDGSPAILVEYAADARAKVVSQANRGPGAARNAGLELATGEWVSFVDADDEIENDYFTSFAAIAEKADINFFSVKFERNGKIAPVALLDSDGPVADSAMKYRLCSRMAWNREKVHFLGFSVNKFYRRSLLVDNHLRFPEDLRICEDEVFLFDVLERARTIRVDPVSPYVYHQHRGGLTLGGHPPFLLAAEYYRRFAESTGDRNLMLLARRRVEECCRWRQASYLGLTDARRMYALLEWNLAKGRSVWARTIRGLRCISDKLAFAFAFVLWKLFFRPDAGVDWEVR